ncbi:hypothetical protein HK099_008136 [Clydaea vesicula]|uniref:C2H2-type domain-containing protein n=1 Tax=Clydaea vesicula TaxID=447962 RepID=A0AAD5TWD1_9FUNG|nr:hypothetical protein HK099_008136 [Clydaea vesicula]
MFNDDVMNLLNQIQLDCFDDSLSNFHQQEHHFSIPPFNTNQSSFTHNSKNSFDVPAFSPQPFLNSDDPTISNSSPVNPSKFLLVNNSNDFQLTNSSSLNNSNLNFINNRPPPSPLNSMYSPLSEPAQSPLLNAHSPLISSQSPIINNFTKKKRSPQSYDDSNFFITSTPQSPPVTPLLAPIMIPSSPTIQLNSQFVNLSTSPNPNSTSNSTTTKKKDALFKCPCGKSFKKIHSLELHSKLHQKDRAFGCNVCGKRFLRPHDLKRHKVTHIEGYHPFECGTCGITFTRQDAKQRHVNSKKCISKVPATVE